MHPKKLCDKPETIILFATLCDYWSESHGCSIIRAARLITRNLDADYDVSFIDGKWAFCYYHSGERAIFNPEKMKWEECADRGTIFHKRVELPPSIE